MSDKTNGKVESCKVEASTTPKKEEKNTRTSKDANSNQGGFCVYIGPTIVGLVQQGSIFGCPKSEATKRLADAIEKYPLIKSLIIDGEKLPAAKAKIAKHGNHLNAAYNTLVNEIK